MTDPVQPRPQPVVDLASFGANIVVVVGGLAFIVDGIATATHWTWAISCGAGLTGAAAFLSKYVPKLAAIGAAAQVTPLSDPRDHLGKPLTTSGGKHRAPEGGSRRYDLDEVIREFGIDLDDDDADVREQVQHGLDYMRDRYGETNRTDTQEIPRVTDHPTRKLGKRPTDPNRPVLRMGAHFTAAAFQAPASVDYASRVPSWLLGGNDKFGTCGPTSVANLALLVSTLLADAPVTFTDDEIFDLYRRSGNPNFDPTTGAGDGGVDMTVMLSELVKNGIGKGDRNVKAVAFGSVDPHDTAKLWAAGCLFGGVLWGADLDVAQQAQTDAGLWDYKRSGTWGGHAILSAPAYSDQPGTLADRTKLVTWAELIAATDTFITNQVSECYVVLFPWHLGDKRIYEALDMQGVADEYTQLTGRPFPGPVAPPTPVPPAPAPGPVPAPTPALPPASVAALMARILHRKGSPKEDVAAATDYDAWLAAQ